MNETLERNSEVLNTTPVVLDATMVARLRAVPILVSLTDETIHCLDGAQMLTLHEGTTLVRQGELIKNFWILLEGELQSTIRASDGHVQSLYLLEHGAAFGEVPLLANIASILECRAKTTCKLLQLDEQQFWVMMTACPEVRKAVLGNMAMRMQKMQATIFQQEKMAALGMMAAGLMHELNNPGAAARRASQQLRENLDRMHRLSHEWAKTEMSREQKSCMVELQEYALGARERMTLSSLEQSDAEEALVEWMEEAHIQDGWKLAPGLTAMGISAKELACARSVLDTKELDDALNWLEAMVSSTQLVGTIEDSIGRVSELVMAVKSYAYEGRGQRQSIDVNKSIHATMVMLGHKLREKQIVLEKELAQDLPSLVTECEGLNQIWTNLLDNAVDASPQGGHIEVKTWPESGEICILVRDHGTGIPLESQPHIFEPFYTTKPSGVGTGLGLGIVHRIVDQYHGSIRFSSEPGETEFVVRLPAQRV